MKYKVFTIIINNKAHIKLIKTSRNNTLKNIDTAEILIHVSGIGKREVLWPVLLCIVQEISSNGMAENFTWIRPIYLYILQFTPLVIEVVNNCLIFLKNRYRTTTYSIFKIAGKNL